MRLRSTQARANCVAVRPLFLRVRLDRLRHRDRLVAEFGLHHPTILARDAGVRRRRGAGRVFAGEHAARQRAVGHDADAVVIAGRQDLDLGHAVHRVVVGLADDRLRHAEVGAQGDDLGDAPAAIVGHAEVSDLPGSDQIADRFDRLDQRRVGIVLVQVVDVDVVGGEPLQAVVAGADDPAPGQARRRAAPWSSRCRPWWRESSGAGWTRSPGPTIVSDAPLA